MLRKGGGLKGDDVLVSRAKLKKELLKRVNADSDIDLEKVERYLSLWEMYKKLYEEAKKTPMIVTKNGAQEFTKTNPAIAEMNKINSSMVTLSKDMGLSNFAVKADISQTYSKSDLV